MIDFQHPTFLALNNFRYKHLDTKLLSQFGAVHNYGTRNTRTSKQNCLKLLYTQILLYPCWSVSHSSLAIFWSHVNICLLYKGIFYIFFFLDCVRYNEDLVKSRFLISRFCSMHLIVIFGRAEETCLLYQGLGYIEVC